MIRADTSRGHTQRAPASHTSVIVEAKKAIDRYVGIPLHWLLHATDALLSPFLTKPPVDEVRTVVLTKIWGIGNLVMILPYVQEIRRHYPRARLVFLTLERNRELLEGGELFEEVVTMRDHGLLAPVIDLFRAIRRLRRRRVDLFLDFEQFLRVSGLIGRLSGARQSIGFDTPGQHRARLYQARIPYDHERHMASVFGDVVRAAGVGMDRIPAPRVPRCSESRRQVLAELGNLPRPWVILHPGSGDNFPGRRWPSERFAAVARKLVQTHGATILLTGTRAESGLLATVADSLPSTSVVSCADRFSLRQLVELIDQSDLVISNDTGPVHLAAAVETPVVALYGPNTPRLYGPLGPDSRALYHRLPCSPCLTNLNAKSSRCRLPSCILAISVEEVLETCAELLRPRLSVPMERTP